MSRERTPTFGETIRALRAERGLSLRAVAGSAHISPTYLSQLERDQSTPTEAVVFRLAEVLECNEDELLGITGRVAEDLQKIVLQQPREMAALILALKDLPGPEIAKVTKRVQKTRSRLG